MLKLQIITSIRNFQLLDIAISCTYSHNKVVVNAKCIFTLYTWDGHIRGARECTVLKLLSEIRK
uniref:Uncharacterized protein n=1 Tax=Anguilla anguilla TaxID=7936 RepID=A0A0E9XIY2_ANGAN